MKITVAKNKYLCEANHCFNMHCISLSYYLVSVFSLVFFSKNKHRFLEDSVISRISTQISIFRASTGNTRAKSEGNFVPSS